LKYYNFPQYILKQKLRKNYEKSDDEREKIIKASRVILKNSKKAIYALHRDNSKKANELLESANDGIKKIKKTATPKLLQLGSFQEAQEEFAEASFYYAFVNAKKMPSPKELEVNDEAYLGGVCDLVGELVRTAINASINEEYKKTLQIKNFVALIYEEMLMFDFRNSPLRRKFDAIKYGLDKLEDLILDLKLKGKLK
ncbi:hypothetical protein ACFLZN_01550, partial [Nanoarchaeota archaeon]